MFGMCGGSFWTRVEMSSSSLQQQSRPPPTDPKQLLRLRSSTPRTGPARQAAWAQQVSKPWRGLARGGGGGLTPRRGALPLPPRRDGHTARPRRARLALEERWRELEPLLRRRDSETRESGTVSQRAPPFFLEELHSQMAPGDGEDIDWVCDGGRTGQGTR